MSCRWTTPQTRCPILAVSNDKRLAEPATSGFSAEAGAPPGLHIQVLHVERVLFDEVSPWLDRFTHQQAEDLVRFHAVVDPYLQQGPRGRVHRGVPQLYSRHFAQALVSLRRNPRARV